MPAESGAETARRCRCTCHYRKRRPPLGGLRNENRWSKGASHPLPALPGRLSAQHEALEKSFLDSLAFAATELRLLTDNYLAFGVSERPASKPAAAGYADPVGARWYNDQGWNVLLPDQRGHGNSEGGYVGWGYDERLDVVGWATYIARKDPGAEIVLHGVSMGAASILMATGGPMPRQVRAVVSDCSYTSIEAEMRHLLNHWADKPTGLPMPAGVMFSALRKTVLRRAGFDLRDVSPIEAVRRSRTPTLFIHGVDDKFVPASMMGKLYQTARCPKNFLWMPGAGHAAAVGTDQNMYWASVSGFLQQCLPEKAAE